MNKFLSIAITTSVLLHGALLFGLPMLPTALNDKKPFVRTMRLIRKEKPKVETSKLYQAPPPPKYVDRLSAYDEKNIRQRKPSVRGSIRAKQTYRA
jgi:hypothetical protein